MLTYLTSIWPIVWKEVVAGGGVAGLLALAWFVPFLRKPAIVAATVIGTWTVAYNLGVRDEHRSELAQWNAAVDQETKNGEKARADAERTTARDTPDSVRHDECNRDNWRTGQQAC